MSLINKASSFFRPIRRGSKCGASHSGRGVPRAAVRLSDEDHWRECRCRIRTKAGSDSHGVVLGPRVCGRPPAALFFERLRTLSSLQFIFNGLRAADCFIFPGSLHWLCSCNSLVSRAASAVGAGAQGGGHGRLYRICGGGGRDHRGNRISDGAGVDRAERIAAADAGTPRWARRWKCARTSAAKAAGICRGVASWLKSLCGNPRFSSGHGFIRAANAEKSMRLQPLRDEGRRTSF